MLRDYRAAAQVLLRGGLFHDAAIIFLQKLNDRRAAAQAFESASEFDRALELYRQLEQHVLAANLLRRLGDEDAAITEFQLAAENYATAGDYHAAGNVMIDKAQRPDLARGYFERGWQCRPAGNAVACAIRLAHLYGDQRAPDHLIALATEASVFFDSPGNESGAELFYNTLALLADSRELASLHEELRDRALVGLAVKVRQRAAVETLPGTIVSQLLGRSGHWNAAVVRDAQVAVARAVKEHSGRPAARPSTRVRLGTGQVTAVAQAPHTGEVFAGFKSGDVVSFRPASSEVVRIKSGDGLAIGALSAGHSGQTLLVLQGGEQASLTSYSRSLDGGYLMNIATLDAVNATYWLPPVLSVNSDCWYVAGTDEYLQMRTVLSLVGRELHTPIQTDQIVAVLVFPTGNAPDGVRVILYARNMLWHTVTQPHSTVEAGSFRALSLGWTPGVAAGNPLLATPLSCLRYAGKLELAGVDEAGVLHWSRLTMSDHGLLADGACDLPCEGGYLAATLLRPGCVAAVRASRVEWLRTYVNNFFALQESADVRLPQAVACFTSAATNELLVVCRDGTLERLALPVA